jgi:putative peptide zinc metalloprotease protein
MNQNAPANELERRKLLKLRLRTDLVIEPQRYEGKTYYVVKDPVSLRYYRLKDNEHFLLQFMDGQRTLEEAQKAYEKRFRPDRLEGFAQQLLTAGLAQNDSPRAGKQLFERRKKRRRSEWLQALTNILYIKIPVFDPDRTLVRMLRHCKWIFTLTFFLISVGIMLAAVLLVATHFEQFRSKLPNYHEFFSFKTVVYLWIALGVVKVIHEFGHGLSCKVFGGEVHEMGALFLCFSPALYCNVSDAWTLPNKWHRIIISAAGIYVELIIASLATFVWWNTNAQPFVNNLALSLMVVCSVSTVVFNANPLMRYDGYYVLADWLEIPNLRERSNRFLKNLVLEYCLGVEVVPEGYMALWRRILFVTYAIVSYIYRWVVTFAILWFMDNFLRPYKLEIISHLLTAAAIGSMVGWPLYRLGQNLHRRGRLPDMKRSRVLITSSVLVVLLLFVFLVPVPVSRIRAVGMVQARSDATSQVFFLSSPGPDKVNGGVLTRLNVQPGDHVRKGDILAEFRNYDLENEIEAARTEKATSQVRRARLEEQRDQTTDQRERGRLGQEVTRAEGKYQEAKQALEAKERLQENQMVLKAPRDGVIGQAPHRDDVGKFFEPDPNQNQPLFTINDPGRLRICLPVVTHEFNQLRENLESPTRAAAKTFKRLRRKVAVNYDKARLADVLQDLSSRKELKGVRLVLAENAGVRPDLLVTYQSDKETLSTILDGLLAKYGLGYVVVSNEDAGDRDGQIEVRPGEERGFANDRPLAPLPVTIRVHGRDSHTWKGRIQTLPESEARRIPQALSNRSGGPVAVKAGGNPNVLVPQTQHYLVYIDLEDSDGALLPGNMAQVKIHCRPETCAHWLWRTVNNLFDLGLL